MLYRAFLQIRMMGWAGKAEQAAELADLFHNLPQEMWRDYFSVSFLRLSAGVSVSTFMWSSDVSQSLG
jgi:hypothetical protein